MDVRSAELTKYATNAMLATRISFINELALLAEKLGADIEWVRHGIGSYPRIGHHSPYAGCGYGGACFPKGVKALIKTAGEASEHLHVLHAVELANDAQKQVLISKVSARFGDNLQGKRFGVWGLAFRLKTDDIREATSRLALESLIENGATVVAYGPVAKDEARRIFGGCQGLTLADSSNDADPLIIVTEWKEFRSPDFAEMKALLKQPVIFNGRSLYDPDTLKAQGFEHYGIGRGADTAPTSR